MKPTIQNQEPPTLFTYFYPDPFGTGESVAIQAESQEAALQQLQKQQSQPALDADEAENQESQ